MNRLDFNQGVRAAARYLTQTADDLEQGLPRRIEANTFARAQKHLGWEGTLHLIRADQSKVVLLRGQASNIERDLLK